MSQENVETARAEVEAVRHRDWQALSDLWDPLVLIRTDPNWPEQGVYGRENALAWMRGVLASGGHDFFAESMREIGDRVLMHMRWQMRGDQSGAQGDMRYVQIDTFREGRIILLELFLDEAQALRAVGLD